MIAQRRRDEQLLKETYSAAERERIVRAYIPDPVPTANITSSKQRRSSKKPLLRKTSVYAFLTSQLYQLTYTLVHIVFGIVLRLIQSYRAVAERIFAIVYYHHRTPELIQRDVKGLKRLPEHLTVLLSLRKEDDALAVLVDEVAELCAWCTCSGISTLSVYEKTGILKSCIPALYQAVTSKFSSYYASPSDQPHLRLFAPHHPIYEESHPSSSSSSSADNTPTNPAPKSLTLLLLSATDGQETFVDLTKTLAEMSQNGKLSPQDITTELVDAEISEITTQPSSQSDVNGNLDADAAHDNSTAIDHPLVKPEPDLLLVFGSSLILDGYPPWHIRLTEMYCTGATSDDMTGYGEAVEYQGFLRGLWHFAGAQMRFGQ